MQNLYLFCKKKKKKPTSLFYTPIFTKHLHQFFYSIHLFNRIFIILQFFIISSLPLSLTHPTLPNNQSTPTINPPSHRQWDQPPSSSNQPPLSTHPLSSRKAKYPKTYSIRPDQPKYPKPHSTQRKAKSTPFNPKSTDQTTRNKGKRLERLQREIGVIWDQQSMVVDILNGGERLVVMAIGGR